MNLQTAKRIIETFEENNKRMFALLYDLKDECDIEDYKKIKREIARVATGIDTNLYPLVLSKYPELNPLNKK